MAKQTITDFYGRILGTVEIESNGDKTARDFYGNILGHYKKSQNVTTDFYGRPLGSGDFVVSLIHNNKK